MSFLVAKFQRKKAQRFLSFRIVSAEFGIFDELPPALAGDLF